MKGRPTNSSNAQVQQVANPVDDTVAKKVSISKSDTNKQCVDNLNFDSTLQCDPLVRVRSGSVYDHSYTGAGRIKYRHTPSLETLDEVGPLVNEFQRRQDSWSKSTSPWWKGHKMDFGDYWPGCKRLPYALREGNMIESSEEKADSSVHQPSSSKRKYASVAGLLYTYLNQTTMLFAQLPQGYIEKDELKVPEPPQDLPIWKWSQVMSNAPNAGSPGIAAHYGISLERVFHRRHFLLRLLNGSDTQRQAIIYVNNTNSVEWLTHWIKSQGLSVNAIHQGLLMAHVHWILSEFTLKKFSVLVMSNDHLQFHSSALHFGNVSLILHYELPVTNSVKIWNHRNRVVETSASSQIEIVTFFRKDSIFDRKFKELIENKMAAHEEH